LYLFGIHFQHTLPHNDPQIVDFFLFEGTLLWFQIEVMLLEDVQHSVDVHPMSLTVLLFRLPRSPSGVDGDVIHIYGEPSLSHLFTKDGVHHHLECGREVGEAKKYHRGFEKSFWSEEGCLPFIPWFDSNIVVSPVDIELREEGAATKAVNSLWDQGRDIAILPCPLIHRSIVLYQA
jgi:hypothetical protein